MTELLLAAAMLAPCAEGTSASAAAALPSSEWKVETRVDGGAWTAREVRLLPVGSASLHNPFPPEILSTFGGIEMGVEMARGAMCEFDFDRPVDVRVTASVPDVLSLSAFRDIPVERPEAGELRFRLDRPEMGIVCRGRDYVRGLSLVARPSPAKADVSKFRHVVRFAPGWHDASNDTNIVLTADGAPVVSVTRDDTLVMLEPGARVCAAVDVKGARHVEISGGGMIDLLSRLPHFEDGFTARPLYGAFRKNVIPAVYVHAGAEDVLVRDLTLLSDFRGINSRNAKRLAIRDVRIYTAVTNGDGINLIASEDVVCERLYIRSQDDAFCAYNNCDSITWLWDGAEAARGRATRNMRLSDSFLASNARALVLGGHGIAGVRGYPNVLEDLVVSGCRILGNVDDPRGGNAVRKNHAYWSGIFRVLSQSDELVRNLTFRDCVVEWMPGYDGQPFHFCVRDGKKASYSETAGWKIEGLRFENIAFRNVPDERLPSFCVGVDPKQTTFSNVTFNGRPADAKFN